MKFETYICLNGRHQSTTERKNRNKFVNDCACFKNSLEIQIALL